ncbi:MAG: sigma 54-interacting transcriptional regulator [Candidatus Methylomirabilales bacterium]
MQHGPPAQLSPPRVPDAERHRTLLDITNAVIANLTPEPLFRAIAEALRRVIPFDRTALFLHDPDKDVLRLLLLETALPSDYFFTGLEMPAGDSHVGWVFRQRRPLLRHDLRREQQYPMEQRAYADGVRSYVIVPLLARERCIGVLAAASTRPGQYTQADAAFLQEAANQVALAVANMQAYEEIRRLTARAEAAAARHRTLLEITNALVSNLSREALFRAIAAALRRVVHFERSSIFLHDAERDVLKLFVLESSLPSAHLAAGWEEQPDRSSGGWVLRHRRPLVRRDLAREREYPTEDLALADGVRSYAVVPLIVRDSCIGTLAVSSTAPAQYGEADVAFLQEVANQVALAVENLRAYESLAAEVARRREAEDALREAVQFSQEIVDGANEGIIVYDTELRYMVFNRFMEALTGRPAAEVLGRYAPDAFPFLREQGMEAMLRRALQGEVLTTPDIRIEMPTGRTVWESNRYSPHRDARGNINGVIALVGDITQRKEAEDALRQALAEVQELKNRLQAENVYLQEEIRREHDFTEMVGGSPALLAVLRKVEQVAPTDSTVLIVGETGTGKELFARAIHSRSGRRDRPLVKVNCSAISAGLVESELFGHVKGAFTGALERRVGRFELADGGTIFLDEVGELPPDTQVKLLRVLQEQEFEPVGSSRTTRVDVRVIAATNRNLEEAVAAGRFRADLYYRLNVFPLAVPPLRARPQDVPLLVTFFVSRFAKKFGKRVSSVPRETLERLARYAWPGNIRELQNVVERAVILSPGPVLELGADLLAPQPGAPPAAAEPPRREAAPGLAPPADLPTLQEAERRHILAALAQSRGVIEGPRGAAKILGLHPNTLRSRLQRLGIPRTPHGAS